MMVIELLRHPKALISSAESGLELRQLNRKSLSRLSEEAELNRALMLGAGTETGQLEYDQQIKKAIRRLR